MKDKPAPVFSAKIEIIGINPFVYLPVPVLTVLFIQAGKEKGKIPVKLKMDGHEFRQTLIKYSGHWRLYLNTPMRKRTGKEVGDTATFEISFDTEKRIVPMLEKLKIALQENKKAEKIFNQLAPSLQLEIVRYLSFLKTEESIDKNVKKAIDFLMGKNRFIGRDPIQPPKEKKQ